MCIGGQLVPLTPGLFKDQLYVGENGAPLALDISSD